MRGQRVAGRVSIDRKQKGFGKGVEAFGGDQFKKSAGDTSEDVAEAAKEWSGVEETKP